MEKLKKLLDVPSGNKCIITLGRSATKHLNAVIALFKGSKVSVDHYCVRGDWEKIQPVDTYIVLVNLCEPGIEVPLIELGNCLLSRRKAIHFIAIMEDDDSDEIKRLVSLLNKLENKGLIGLDILGNEDLFYHHRQRTSRSEVAVNIEKCSAQTVRAREKNNITIELKGQQKKHFLYLAREYWRELTHSLYQ